MRLKLRYIKSAIKFKLQTLKKGYCDNDLYSIDSWFIDIFPKMLEEFIECTCGCPIDEKSLKEEVTKMPLAWLIIQEDKLKHQIQEYDLEFSIEDSMCCWLLILLRMKYCFEMCDEWNSQYEPLYKNNKFEEVAKEIDSHKKEGFYLLEKYFSNLWW